MSNPQMGPQANPYGNQQNGNHLPTGTPFFNWIRSLGLQRGSDRWLGGVCSSLAHRLGWDPLIVRIIWFALTLFAGIGIVLYGLAWITLPDERDGSIVLQEATFGRVRASLIIGVIMVVIGLTSSTIFVPALGVILIIAVIGCAIGFSIAAHNYHPQSQPTASSPTNFSATGFFDSTIPTRGNPSPANTGTSSFTNPSPVTSPVDGVTPAGSAQTTANPAQQPSNQPTYQYHYQYQSQPTPQPIPRSAPQPAFQQAPAKGPKNYSTYDQYMAKNHYYKTWRKASNTLALVIFGVLALTGGAAAIVCAAIPEIGDVSSWLVIFHLWAVSAFTLMGIVLIVLGVTGRRAGKVAGLAWLVAVITFFVGFVPTLNGFSTLELDPWYHNTDLTSTVIFDSRTITSKAIEQSIAENGSAQVSIVFANGTIDLTDTSSSIMKDGCPSGNIKIDVVFGHATLLVPHGCQVDTASIGIFAGEVDRPSSKTLTGVNAPPLTLTGDTAFGQFSIQSI